nr:oxidoreductase C-terminal domain-containing protein [Acuticoccus mangrovi]
MCGKERPHDSVPWFWSDQFDLKLQIAGLNHGYDTLALRGDPEAGRSFAAFYLREGKIIAADCINRPAEFMLSKRLVAEGRAIDPAALSDDTRRFKEVVAEASR